MAKRKASKVSKAAARPPKAQDRPLGVTVICVLSWIVSFFAVAGGLFLFAFGSFMAMMPVPLVNVMGAAGSVVGLVFLVIGAASAVVTYWLWLMQRRGWTWSMVLTGIGFLASIASFNVVGVLIALVVLAYLWMKRELFK